MDEKNKVAKLNKKKSSLLLFLIIFIVGNISFYVKERAKWMYEGQPYPKAKEWLIPANMMLVYGVTLTTLPFIDERSWIMKPVIGLQDYFVKKWQENLPDDDAEKYLGWYFFNYMGGIVHNSSSILMYANNRYSYEETREALDKMWYTLEHITQYRAKDKEFEKMRYGAFNNLSLSYVKNAPIYWFHKRQPLVEIYSTSPKQYFLDINMMLKDINKTNRYILLFKWIDKMDKFYEKRYPQFYYDSKNDFSESTRMSDLVEKIIFILHKTNKYKDFDSFCDIKKNIFLKKHIESRDILITLKNKKNIDKKEKDYLISLLNRNADKQFNKICKNLNFIQGVKNGNN